MKQRIKSDKKTKRLMIGEKTKIIHLIFKLLVFLSVNSVQNYYD